MSSPAQLGLPGLVTEPRPVAVPAARGRFLTEIRACFDAITASPSMAAVIEGATASVVGSGRDNGLDFEDALWERLEQAQEDVSREAAAAHQGHAWSLQGVTWSVVPVAHGGQAPADLFAHLHLAGGSELRIPVNVKREVREHSSADACSIRTLIRVAMGRSILDTRRIDVRAAEKDWATGRRRIQPADYYLLIVTGEQPDWRFQGLLSAVREDGHLALRRGTAARSIQYLPATGLLHPDHDVNVDFARVLAEVNSDAGLNSELLSAALRHDISDPAQLRRLAGLGSAEVVKACLGELEAA